MRNKVIFSTILFSAVILFSFFVLGQAKNRNQVLMNETNKQQRSSEEPLVLFYGEGCPHCALVEEYLKKNDLKNKIGLVEKEVYYNQKNAKELQAKAQGCGLSTDSIGVPFLWTGKDCILGDQDIINFFEQKIKGN
jgi:glutaredoxin